MKQPTDNVLHVDIPEKIYLNRREGLINFSTCIPISNSVEYLRSDIAKAEAEKLAKDMIEWWINYCYFSVSNNYPMTFRDDSTGNIISLDELFAEFINSRKK
jgi:hypothetical protein